MTKAIRRWNGTGWDTLFDPSNNPDAITAPAFTTTSNGVVTVNGTGYFQGSGGNYYRPSDGTNMVIYNGSGATLLYAPAYNFKNVAGTDRMTIDASGNVVAAGTVQGTRLISTVATGTAPLSITSTTAVPNLNASFVNGFTPEFCKVYNSTNISLTSGTVTPLTFDSEYYDSSGAMHSLVTNTGRINFPTAGTYCIMLNARFAQNAIGMREIAIRNSAGSSIAMARGSASVSSTAGTTYTAQALDMRLFTSCIYTVTANDWVDATAWQNSGGALNLEAVSTFSPVFSAFRIG